MAWRLRLRTSKTLRESHAIDKGALMRHFTVISELLEHIRTLGWKPYQADHEDGNGQFELNWEYDDCLATADKHTFFKFMAKSVPKSMDFEQRSCRSLSSTKRGCHVSVWNPDSSSNLFHAKDGELGLSELAYNFLAGVLESSQV